MDEKIEAGQLRPSVLFRLIEFFEGRSIRFRHSVCLVTTTLRNELVSNTLYGSKMNRVRRVLLQFLP
jgi:hypothetical protein